MPTRARKSPKPRRDELPPAKEAGVLAATLDVLRMYGVDCDRHNVGGLTGATGRYVRFGRRGDADIRGVLGPDFGPALAGKVIHVECKRPGFRPGKLTGKAREHFDRQFARLKQVNDNGGFGLWIDDAAAMIRVLERIRQGWRVVFDEHGLPHMDDGQD